MYVITMLQREVQIPGDVFFLVFYVAHKICYYLAATNLTSYKLVLHEVFRKVVHKHIIFMWIDFK